jgi:hypothetical protein
VGFSSLGTFSVLFKKHVGSSPKNFRRQIRCWVTTPGYSPWIYNGFRWVTVNPKAQPDLEIALMKIEEGPMCDAGRAATLKTLVKEGAFCVGVFETSDCRATYEELKARGVEFMSPPEEKFYGIEAVGKDNSGNWFSMSEPLKPN